MITEFLRGDVSVYSTVFNYPTGKPTALFLGLFLNSIKILSLLNVLIICFYLVSYLILNVLSDFVLLGGGESDSIFLSTSLATCYF